MMSCRLWFDAACWPVCVFRRACRRAPKELRFAMAGEPKSFDPLQVSDSNSETVRYLTAGVLMRVNRVTDKLQPELAESFELKDGGRTIAFRLRAGLQFSDGSPLTSADVARTLNRALDPKQASPIGDTLRSTEGESRYRDAFSARDHASV